MHLRSYAGNFANLNFAECLSKWVKAGVMGGVELTDADTVLYLSARMNIGAKRAFRADVAIGFLILQTFSDA